MIASTGGLVRADLAETGVLVDAPPNTAAWAQVALRWLVRAGDDPLPSVAEGVRVGLSDVEAVRTTTQLFSDLDSRFGGDHGRRTLAQFVQSTVLPQLRGNYTDAVGRPLYAAAAEAVHLLAWMSYDSGAHGIAQRYFVQALRLAQAGDDERYAASALDAMSHQATFLGRHQAAADLARAARTGTRGRAWAAQTAHFLAMEARALSAAGEVRAAERALSDATRHFDVRRPEDDPEFIAYFDEGEMHAEIAHCFRDLGVGSRAVDAARSAMTGSPRSDFFVSMVEADGLLQLGAVEESAAVARAAIDVGAGMRSARCIGYVRDYRSRLAASAGDSPATGDLAEQLQDNPLWISAGHH